LNTGRAVERNALVGRIGAKHLSMLTTVATMSVLAAEPDLHEMFIDGLGPLLVHLAKTIETVARTSRKTSEECTKLRTHAPGPPPQSLN
jgi:hypothetical protein